MASLPSQRFTDNYKNTRGGKKPITVSRMRTFHFSFSADKF
jgi:hypothetical protein